MSGSALRWKHAARIAKLEQIVDNTLTKGLG